MKEKNVELLAGIIFCVLFLPVLTVAFAWLKLADSKKRRA